MENEKKKYNQMENVLNKINQKYISLPEDEKKRNNKILEQVTDRLASLMKDKDVLFRSTYERKFYGGSFYDKIKVGKPEEYDLDLVLNLPAIIDPILKSSDKPGFVNIQITQSEYKRLSSRKEWNKFKKLHALMDSKNFLSTVKVLQWIERTIHLSLNGLKRENDKYYIDVDFGNSGFIRIYVMISKAHPAFTLKLRNEDETISLDIDLVPCFQFKEDKWPEEGYRKNPFPKIRNTFLIVPKKPHGMENCDTLERYWRLSFQEQERDLITGQELKTTKPAIKLLKKLRDKQNHIKIASYYIKTIFLWKLETEEVGFWKQSLSYVLMTMLQTYADMIQNKKVPYYWNDGNNLIGHVKEATLKDIGNTLRNIIVDVETNLDDPFVIAKYLITQEQLDKLRCEVILSNKSRRKLKYAQSLFSPSASHYSSQSQDQSQTEKMKRLMVDKEFVQEVSEHIEKYLQPQWKDKDQF
ncbi:uncharacterized protein LOC108915173 [Anoplophora glabripennis]|uniref:uncharacterized protein LOC108915173 n=1 Tax=Anoplophora glabripennis TaxID=217634 RepID=UPI00087371AD|nr:uncharacterized protein LOC108915173 [Anoplophora glabripennis]